MNTTTKPRRSGAKIMAQLIVLLGSLVYIMLLAVINGTAGFLCAMGVTLSGAAAIAKALGEEISLSYGALIALAVGCGVLRGLLRFAEQYGNHYIAFRLLAVLLNNPGKVLTQRQLLNQVWGPNAVEHSHYLRIYMGHLRQKLEVDPARPQHLLTETGIGYRFMP